MVNNYKTYGSPGSTDDMNHLIARGGLIGTANKKWNLIRSLLLLQRMDAQGDEPHDDLRAWEWVQLNPVTVAAVCAGLVLVGFLSRPRASAGWVPTRKQA